MAFAQVGQPAPAFHGQIARAGDSPAGPVSSVSLDDYRGKWLIEFTETRAEVLGASTDSVYAHRAWMWTPRDQNGIAGIEFPCCRI